MAFDENSFYEAQGDLIDQLRNIIKQLYELNRTNPEFQGRLNIKHNPKGNPEPKWELTIKGK